MATRNGWQLRLRPRRQATAQHRPSRQNYFFYGGQHHRNPRYLARHPGFSLPTVEEDIEDPGRPVEGNASRSRGQQYRLTRHGFRLLSKL
ncbi:hypothetical protein [Hymenobacter rubripertinctus]|uniref:hypothetical protein n=1 Tax=Hymenobacter rubripertinctus TaxID=2029981 RepID=UPI000E6923EA|nr:hypothetical protein [Hymenobacter rubripertinctus]